MKVANVLRIVVGGLLAVALCQPAWAEVAGPPVRPKGPFRGEGGQGRPGLGRPGGPRRMMPGMSVPAVQQEMKRHGEAMRALMTENRELAMQVRKEVRALREKEADKAAIEAALEKFKPQAEAAAGKLADELALHHENLAKIFKENRDAVAKELAKEILRRMASPRGPRRGGPGPGGGPPFPKGKGRPPMPKEAPPENF